MFHLFLRFANHERSKKHKENAALLKQMLEKEEEEQLGTQLNDSASKMTTAVGDESGDSTAEDLETVGTKKENSVSEQETGSSVLPGATSASTTGIFDFAKLDIDDFEEVETAAEGMQDGQCSHHKGETHSEEDSEDGLSYSMLGYVVHCCCAWQPQCSCMVSVGIGQNISSLFLLCLQWRQ